MSLGFTFHLPGYFPLYTNLTMQETVESDYIVTKIYTQFYKQMVVEWSIPAEWGHCYFDVYKSESQGGPWKKATPASIDGNAFQDINSKANSKFINTWYRVECQLPDGRRIQGPITTWENKRNSWVELRAREIQRRETILLTKFVGVDTLLIRRRHFGKRCHNCWNFEIEKVTQDHCPVCLGTSFEGGYYAPFKTLAQYEATPNDAKLGYQGRDESDGLMAWTTSYPQIEVFDLVYRMPDSKMFRVDHIMSTELQTVSVRQIMNLTELAKESIEFQLADKLIPSQYL